MKSRKKIIKLIREWETKYSDNNIDFLSRHPEYESFSMPKTFYFRILPDRLAIHWAIIKEVENKAIIYFINDWGRVFDKLELKSVKIARRQLRKNGFEFSTNRYCPKQPPQPIYINLSEGKKSAPYSKGNLWKSVKRNERTISRTEKRYLLQFYNHMNYLKDYNYNHATKTFYKLSHYFDEGNFVENKSEKIFLLQVLLYLLIVVTILLITAND